MKLTPKPTKILKCVVEFTAKNEHLQPENVAPISGRCRETDSCKMNNFFSIFVPSR